MTIVNDDFAEQVRVVLAGWRHDHRQVQHLSRHDNRDAQRRIQASAFLHQTSV